MAGDFESVFLTRVVDEMLATSRGMFGDGPADGAWRGVMARAIADGIVRGGRCGARAGRGELHCGLQRGARWRQRRGRAVTALHVIDALTRLLEEENEALRAGDVERAAWFASKKDAAAARLTEAAPEIATLRHHGGMHEVGGRLAALGALLRRNERLVAHAGDALRDLIAALESQDGRAGGYDEHGTRTHASRTGAMLNKSI